MPEYMTKIEGSGYPLENSINEMYRFMRENSIGVYFYADQPWRIFSNWHYWNEGFEESLINGLSRFIEEGAVMVLSENPACYMTQYIFYHGRIQKHVLGTGKFRPGR